MHGYFLSLKLYTTARLIANPQSYSEYRDRIVNEKLKAKSESRIRARKDQPKVNKALAERVRRAEEREKALERKKKEKKGLAEAGSEKMEEGEEEEVAPGLLQDPRFKELWENPEYEVDEESREFALLNPATANNNVSPFLIIRVSHGELIPFRHRPSGKLPLRRRKMKVTGCLRTLKKKRMKKSRSPSKAKEARVAKVTMAVRYVSLIISSYLAADSIIVFQICYNTTPDNSLPLNAVPCPMASPPWWLVAPSPPLSLHLASVFTLSPNPTPPKSLRITTPVSSPPAVPPMGVWRCLSSLRLNPGLEEARGMIATMTKMSILVGRGGRIGWRGLVQGWRKVKWKMTSLKDEEEGCRGEDREGVLQRMLSGESKKFVGKRISLSSFHLCVER